MSWPSTSRLPLAALLLLTCHFKASDPRDKIYALLGLTKDWDENHPIQPDYERKATHLFVEATEMLMEGFDPIDDRPEEIEQLSRKDIPELKPLQILTFIQHNVQLSDIDSPSLVPDIVHPTHAPPLWYGDYDPTKGLKPRWSFPRPGIFRSIGRLHKRIEQVEATPLDYSATDLNRLIHWLSLIPQEIDNDDHILDILGTSLMVFRDNKRFRHPLAMARNAFVRYLHFYAQRRLLYESETKNLPLAQFNLLDWRSNWDRAIATSAAAADPPITPLPTIAEIQDEFNDASLRLLALNISVEEIEQECRAFMTPMVHYTRGRALSKCKTDNIGLELKGAPEGDCVCGLAGAATLFVVGGWRKAKNGCL